jgi:hypothetical protein
MRSAIVRTVKGRIWFPKSPWPKGHAIKSATWSGRLEPTGSLFFDLDLKSADYDAEDPPSADDEDEDDIEDESWKSKVVWNNYGSCSLSSTKWDQHGVEVGSAKKPFDWRKLDTIRADRAKSKIADDHQDNAAFGIYLMGHDAVADHAIRFTRTGKSYAVDWTAKIALAYVGSDKLAYKMRLELAGMTFGGFAFPKGMSPKAARVLFDAAVIDPAKWTIAKRRFVRK